MLTGWRRKIVFVLVCGMVTTIGMRIAFPIYSVAAEPVVPPEKLREATAPAWPQYGQAAIATDAQGVVATRGDQVAYPTASTAKIITILAVLEKKPLAAGEQGPTLTLTEADVALYNAYIASNGSNTPVHAGLSITQRQAMESVMLASSNNMADTLAVWAFGSLAAYHDYANAMVKRLGATHTTLAHDASGLNAATKSTASDMATLALHALKQPALVEIVRQPQADVPFAGTIYNTNRLLGDAEIIGLKTGETVEAGGNFVLAAQRADGGATQHVVVVVMGAPVSAKAQADSHALYQSIKSAVRYEPVVKAGDTVARYTLPWGATVDARAEGDVKAWTWGGKRPAVSLQLGELNQRTGTAAVGSASVANTNTDVAASAPPGAPFGWRVLYGVWWFAN